MIQQHHGEQNVRQRFTEYVQRFVRTAARYEEDQFGRTEIGFRSAPFVPGGVGAHLASGIVGVQLGSGIIPTDSVAFAKELNANASRIEGWRKTRSYEYYATVRIRFLSRAGDTHHITRILGRRRRAVHSAASMCITNFGGCRMCGQYRPKKRRQYTVPSRSKHRGRTMRWSSCCRTCQHRVGHLHLLPLAFSRRARASVRRRLTFSTHSAHTTSGACSYACSITSSGK